MKRLREACWRRPSVCLAIGGLICHFVLSTLAIPAAVAAARAAGLPDGYTSIIICTGSGMKRITLDAQGNPVEKRQPEENRDSHCVACHVVSGKAVAAAPALRIGWPGFRRVLLAATAEQRVCGNRHWRIPENRGPPLEL